MKQNKTKPSSQLTVGCAFVWYRTKRMFKTLSKCESVFKLSFNWEGISALGAC